MNERQQAELRKFVAPEFVYGIGAISLVGRYARNFGAKKALIVTDPGLVESGWVRKAVGYLDIEGVRSAVFQEVTPNPKDHEVMSGVRFYADSGCDVIIAVGGGSTMDCAKCIGIAHANRKGPLEFEGVDEVEMPGPPLICVPTTAGTSADVSQFAIVTDSTRMVKVAVISKTVVPDVALIDPETTTTMPADLTAATGIDALVHAIEAYVSNANSPITDLHALAAVPLITQNLQSAIAAPRDLEPRSKMTQGSLFAGLAFSNASLGLVHAMAHSLGGLLNLPHGECNAVLLDHVVDFNYEAVPARYDRIASAMGVAIEESAPEKRKSALLNAIVRLREKAGIKRTVGTMGVAKKDIPQLAINAFNDPCMATNPRKATVEEIEKLYERAL